MSNIILQSLFGIICMFSHKIRYFLWVGGKILAARGGTFLIDFMGKIFQKSEGGPKLLGFRPLFPKFSKILGGGKP